jgi:uncharacterized protein (TIGR02246 family)
MDEEQDKRAIREVISTWMRASAQGDLDRVLTLMAEDVVFLVAGQPPMRGRAAFEKASRAMAGRVRFEGKSDIQEIQVAGDYAFCWSQLAVTATPLEGGDVMRRAGPVLSVFRKERDGRWLLFRDANLLTAVSQP